MIYILPKPGEPLDQGDLVDGCPVTSVKAFRPGEQESVQLGADLHRIYVLTQTCDLANRKIEDVVIASTFDAQKLVQDQILRAAEVKGPLRSGRVWGLYFLPAAAELGLNEMIVDFSHLHTIRLNLLHELCRAGQRRARLLTPYREHLSKHFADTFCKIGLPQPYETL